MRNRLWRKSSTTTLLITAIMCFTALSAIAQQRDNAKGGVPLSSVSEAQVSEQVHAISVGGRLQPKSRVVHKTFNEGIIRSVAVEEGDFVEVGEELFSIGRRDDVDKVYKPFSVYARITGFVSEVYIQRDDEIEGGEPAVVILGNEGYVLEAYVSDKDAYKLVLNQKVTATTAGGEKITGVLVHRSREPNYDTGLFMLTFHFPEMTQGRIGEFVIIDLPVDRESGVFVKRDSVIRRYGAYYLWIVNGEDQLEAREVVLGSVYGDMVKIDVGLEPGERYVSRLSGREKEGSRVHASES